MIRPIRRPIRPIWRRACRAARLRHGMFALLMLACLPAAHAVDTDAGDYQAAPAGTNLMLVYYQHIERQDVYANGQRHVPGARLDSEVAILRGVRFTQWGKYVADPQFLLPVGRLDAGGTTSELGDASGMGDLILAATVWFVNKPEDKTWFAVTPFLFLPTGSYDRNDPLNLGENRWKAALQAGYVRGLGEKFSLDLLGDFTLYGKNDDFGPTGAQMEQDVSFQFQSWLRYHVNERWDLRTGFSRTWGGETQVDGVDSNDAQGTSRFTVGTVWFAMPSVQVLANYSRDTAVRNGFKEDNRLTLRLLKIF